MNFNFIFLFYNYVFNNRVLDPEDTMYRNVFLTFGLKNKCLFLIESRMEINLHTTIKHLNKNQWELFLKCIYDIIPYKHNIYKRTIMNVYVLDMITSYRGWRHYRGLPVRGQRTWTNSWSCYKSNWLLRNHKLLVSKKNYNNVPIKDIKVASIAEYVNLMWRQQWDYEWLSAKNSRLQFKGNKNTIKIDIYAMANYQVMHPLKLKNLSKKQKQSFKKNYFSLGFDFGFTKSLLQDVYSNETNSLDGLSKSSLIFKDDRLNKKNAPKKKAEVNKNVKKKQKKSVWD